jgi:hypothetical protein
MTIPPKPIELARSPELTARIILRQLEIDPHCRLCLKPLNARHAELLDYDGKFPDVVCLACRTNALEGGGQ